MLHHFGLNPFLFGASNDGNPKGLDLASYGVTIFFTLSGFLISYLLLKEKQIQEINIKHFYFRRILRIWPLYYLYIAIALIYLIVGGFELQLRPLFFYIFYLANVPYILNIAIPILSHYWSLGVEEQFYVFWPWVIKKINNKLTLLVVVLILVIVGVKLLLHFFYPNSLAESVIHITRFHCMLIGALGAVMYFNKQALFLKITDNKASQFIALLVLGLVMVNKFHVASVMDNEIISVVTLFIIIGQINIKNRLINFDIGLFDFLGKISYGIYVIHPLILLILHKASVFSGISNVYIKYTAVYSTTISLTILFSYLSYKYFESHFLKLKERVSVIRTSGSKYISGF